MSDHQIAAALFALPCLTLALSWGIGHACLAMKPARVQRRKHRTF